MAGQVNKQGAMGISSGNVQENLLPTAFIDTINQVNPAQGPVPGGVSIPLGGVAVNFSPLIVPGWVRVQNLDPVCWVEYGVKDNNTGNFYPLGIVKPNLYHEFYFSPNLGKAEEPGTGTHESGTNTSFYLKAYSGAPPSSAKAACNAVVKAYEA
jgi:hypothetical protein